jgi:type I restriction-modification system DNA methylase subunit
MDVEKRKNIGVTYTPKEYSDLICQKTINKIGKVADLSCGTGIFLISAIEVIHNMSGLSYCKIVEDYIYGYDIDSDAISICKECLIDLCIQHDGRKPLKVNVEVSSALVLNNLKFDFIVGNPPYVRIKNICESDRKIMNSMKYTSGNTDFFLVFFEVAFNNLEKNGRIGFICPNSMWRNKSSVKLIDYMISSNIIEEVIDFDTNKVFKDVQTYVNIVILSLSKNKNNYTLSKVKSMKELEFTCYEKIVTKSKYILSASDTDISRYESNKINLLKVIDMKTGLATLADKIFFSDGSGIESGILKKCVKASTYKGNGESYIIFPYECKNGKYIPLSEEVIKTKYPNCYKYLCDNKEKLMKRDKGKIDADKWFLYGRTQGLNSLWKKKILIPPLQKKPNLIIVGEETLLISGYCVMVKDKKYDLNVVKKILESDVFSDYSSHVCKKVGSNSERWFSYSKNTFLNFTIPEFTDAEMKSIKEMNMREFNIFFKGKYETL